MNYKTKKDIKTIGIFSGAFKPFHAGHYASVLKISQENDFVVLFVSNKDRTRKNEFPIMWNNMYKVWEKFLLDIIPNNTQVIFTPNPIGAIYDFLEEKNNKKIFQNQYRIYASKEDLVSRFTIEKLSKYFPDLCKHNLVLLEETGTRGLVSGTDMRRFLLENNKAKFINFLPKPVEKFGNDVWEILKNA